MKKLLLFSGTILLALSLKAQVLYFQGFDGSGLNNWSYTPSPAKYNFPSLNDVWTDTTALGNNSGGNVPVNPFQGTKFWGMNDLENPNTSALPAPYYHYLDFAAASLPSGNSYTLKFKYFTHIVGGSNDSVGYIVEYNNGTTWNTVNYIHLTNANKMWDSVGVAIPANSTHVRLRIVARINGNDDWVGIDAVEVNSTPIPPSLSLNDDMLVTDEAVDTLVIPVKRSHKFTGANSTVDVALVNGFGFTNASDLTLLTPTLSFPPTGADSAYIKIKINNDASPEETEYFAIRLNNAGNATIGSIEETTIYIKDNDYQAPTPRMNIELKHLGSFAIPIAGSSAEISAYDSAANRLYVVNSLKNKLHILDFSAPAAITQDTVIDMSAYGGGINSVAAYKGLIAVAVEASPKTDSGKIVFLDKDGMFLKEVKAGALPDMITFTHDGKYVLTANEGEPNDAYTTDPEGSVTIVDLQNGVSNATATNVVFTSLNSQEAALKAQGIRIYGPGATVAQDFEPEYITISKNSDTAWVSLQENNGIAVIDIANKQLLNGFALGYVDYTQPGNALDASDKTGEPLIARWPVRGLMLPDAIASYTTGGVNYIVTANEGDSRDYDGYSEEERIGSSSYDLDAGVFPEADLLKEKYNLGRLNAVTSLGDIDNDNKFEEIYVMGGRSFSIFQSNGTLVYNSGQQFEQIINADTKYSKLFNADNESNDYKDRSDNKGPEPEGVAIGIVNDTTYAFIALERMGGVMVYDISNPSGPVFVQYINTRDTATYSGDQGAEGIIFIPASQHPTKKNYVVTSNEISGTVAVFEVEADSAVNVAQVKPLPRLNVYPNPANDLIFFSQPVSGEVTDMNGRSVAVFREANNIDISNLAKGIYFVRPEGFRTEKIVIQ